MKSDQLQSAGDPLDSLVMDQAGSKPEPRADIQSLITEALNPAPAEAFDPATHETDDVTGGPVFNSDGSLRRKRGRKAGVNYNAIGNGGVGAGAGQLPPVDGSGMATVSLCSPEQAAMEARMCAGGLFSLAQSLGGVAWEPSESETAEVVGPLAEVIQAYGGLGLPPWALVAFALGKYALARIELQKLIDAVTARLNPPPPAPAAPPVTPPAQEPRPGDGPAMTMPRAVPAGDGGGFAFGSGERAA